MHRDIEGFRPVRTQARLRRPRLPVPIIPIVGEFSTSQSHAFVGLQDIFERIRACHCRAAALLHAATRKGITHPSTIHRLLRRENAAAHYARPCHLIPVPFTTDTAPSLGTIAELPALLHYYSMIAVIAASRTDSTIALLNALSPFQVPICVTVSSLDSITASHYTSPGLHQSYPQLIRLNPPNDQQAQALVAKVRSLLDAGKPKSIEPVERGQTRGFTLYNLLPRNPYCQDLTSAIQRHAETAELDWYSAQGPGYVRLPKEGIVICVGYAPRKTPFPHQLMPYRAIITCDGFSSSDIETYIGSVANDRTRFFVCQPATAPSILVADAFESINDHWREQYHRKAGQGAYQQAAERLLPFLHGVKARLEGSHPTSSAYAFLGKQNVRSGYFIRRLA